MMFSFSKSLEISSAGFTKLKVPCEHCEWVVVPFFCSNLSGKPWNDDLMQARDLKVTN